MPGSTASESSVSEGDTATMSASTAPTSKTAEMPRINSRVNRVRTSFDVVGQPRHDLPDARPSEEDQVELQQMIVHLVAQVPGHPLLHTRGEPGLQEVEDVLGREDGEDQQDECLDRLLRSRRAGDEAARGGVPAAGPACRPRPRSRRLPPASSGRSGTGSGAPSRRRRRRRTGCSPPRRPGTRRRRDPDTAGCGDTASIQRAPASGLQARDRHDHLLRRDAAVQEGPAVA